MKAFGGTEVEPHAFHDLGTRMRWCGRHHALAAFYPGKDPCRLSITAGVCRCRFIFRAEGRGLLVGFIPDVSSATAADIFMVSEVARLTRLRWAGHVARMGESRNAYRVLVGRPEGKRPLGRPRRRWEDNIKMDLRKVGYDDRDWINLAQDRDRWRAYVRAARTFGFLKSHLHSLTPHYTTQTHPHRKQNKRRQDQQQPVLKKAHTRPKHDNQMCEEWLRFRRSVNCVVSGASVQVEDLAENSSFAGFKFRLGRWRGLCEENGGMYA
ncbi:hypothetical protein ANN_16354 [Periplaneta americana]|uniref:Uncharacterized protein n=1 Tax=Periplaneta americana TaxID=6978 RepID=A0ABQ8SIR3_PERAM|nr:hypothetical protein ANN_16354 [Periplaneta americana]